MAYVYVLLVENFHQFRMRARVLARQMVTPESVNAVSLSGLLRSNLAREGNQRRLIMRSVKHHWSHPEKKEQNEGKHNKARTRKNWTLAEDCIFVAAQSKVSSQ